MIIFRKADQLSAWTSGQKKNARTIGFVPTMGALHEGHLSLIREARLHSDFVVCSIFVNPTQFNNPEDFKLYPVTVENDIELLLASGCDALFLPSVEEVYPRGFVKKHYDLGPIETILEGKYRPGHFQGVCQVVDRLLNIVQPDRLFMGQKDFQQCMVISRLLLITGLDRKISLEIVPTSRELDGLAMSSRNLRLNKKQREQAPAIAAALLHIREEFNVKTIAELKQDASRSLEDHGFVVDYVEIAKARDLSPAHDKQGQLVALVAATIGTIRLIDNLPLN